MHGCHDTPCCAVQALYALAAADASGHSAAELFASGGIHSLVRGASVWARGALVNTPQTQAAMHLCPRLSGTPVNRHQTSPRLLSVTLERVKLFDRAGFPLNRCSLVNLDDQLIL